MKRMIVMLVCAAVASLTLSVSDVSARPQYKAGFAKLTKGTKIEEAAKKASCNVCHVKGEKKTVRNDFGKALMKGGLDKKLYTENKADKAELAKKIDEVMKKFLASEDGAKFKKHIEDGKLPGGE